MACFACLFGFEMIIFAIRDKMTCSATANARGRNFVESLIIKN
jgi:hypothetical protein